MKYIIKIILFTPFLLITLTGCSNNKKDENQIRRFAFAVPSETVPDNSNIKDTDLSIQVFKIKEKAFLVIDAPSDYDYSKTLALLKSKGIDNILTSTSPLKRIYKMDQQKEYTSSEGQLINTQTDTKRYVLTLEIVNDKKLRDEYIQVHGIGKAWPEITNNMKQMGIKDMELYLDGYQAYLIMDTRKDFDMAKDGEKWSKLPRESEWQEYVAKFQKVDPQSKATEKWQTMILQK